MLDTGLAVLTVVVTFLTYMDEITWGCEHIPHMVRWCMKEAPRTSGRKYQHNPVATYRVAGPESKI